MTLAPLKLSHLTVPTAAMYQKANKNIRCDFWREKARNRFISQQCRKKCITLFIMHVHTRSLFCQKERTSFGHFGHGYLQCCSRRKRRPLLLAEYFSRRVVDLRRFLYVLQYKTFAALFSFPTFPHRIEESNSSTLPTQDGVLHSALQRQRSTGKSVSPVSNFKSRF